MKNKLLQIAFLLLAASSMISCKKELVTVDNSCPKTYYYYFDEKIPLEKSMNTLCIGFKELYTYEQLSNIIRAYPELKVPPATSVWLVPKYAFVAIDGYHTCDDIEHLMAKLKLNQSITFATQILFSSRDSSDKIGLTDQFIVDLKDLTEENRLAAFAAANDCYIFEQNEYRKTSFILKVRKTAKMDALEMANYFQEVGGFYTASPNFLISVKPL